MKREKVDSCNFNVPLSQSKPLFTFPCARCSNWIFKAPEPHKWVLLLLLFWSLTRVIYIWEKSLTAPSHFTSHSQGLRHLNSQYYSQVLRTIHTCLLPSIVKLSIGFIFFYLVAVVITVFAETFPDLIRNLCILKLENNLTRCMPPNIFKKT